MSETLPSGDESEPQDYLGAVVRPNPTPEDMRFTEQPQSEAEMYAEPDYPRIITHTADSAEVTDAESNKNKS